MSQRVWWSALGVGLGAVLLATAFLLMNTTFAIYDDEGYVLQTYRDFIAGHRLYDDVFSQYGPWPYVYHLLANLILGTPLTHAVGRGLTIVHWVLCSVFCGAIALRLTRSQTAGVAATLLVFTLLWPMVMEPSHPGSLICVTLAAAVTIAVVAFQHQRWTVFAAVLGCASALLVFTKINVGLLFIAGTAAIALRYTAWPARWTSPAATLAVIGLIALPWCLMGQRLHEPRVWMFAVQFTLSVAGVLWVTPSAHGDRFLPPRIWAISATYFAATLLTLALTIWTRGTTLDAFVETVFINPLRHPAHFFLGVRWFFWVWPLTLVCSIIVARAGWELRVIGTLSRQTRIAVIVVRASAFVALVAHTITWVTPFGPGRFINVALPLLPSFLIPLNQSVAAGVSERALLAIVALLVGPQILHAYPVAGSQVVWGTFLLPVILIAGLYDTTTELAGAFSRFGTWLTRLGGAVPIAVGCVQVTLLLHTGWERYRTSLPLGLSGAENIRLDGKTRLALRTLTINAAIHADTLFSNPGMFSYNQWSGVPTPTHKNATLWFWLLNATDQNEIISRLKRAQRSAVVTCPPLVQFSREHNAPSEDVLADFLARHYRPLLTIKDFTFHVPHTSQAVPFGKIDVLVRAPGSTSMTAPVLLQTNVALKGQPAGVQLRGIEYPWTVAQEFSPERTRIALEPITASGQPLGSPISLPHDKPLDGLFRLSIYTDEQPPQTQELVLVLVDGSGTILAEASL